MWSRSAPAPPIPVNVVGDYFTLSMDQAFMLILHDPATRPLTDEQVAEMKMPRQRIEAIVKRVDADQEAALRNTGKGSSKVVPSARGG